MINIANLSYAHIYVRKSLQGRSKDTDCLKKKLCVNFKNDILTRHQRVKARLNRTGLDAHAVNLFSEYKIKL